MANKVNSLPSTNENPNQNQTLSMVQVPQQPPQIQAEPFTIAYQQPQFGSYPMQQSVPYQAGTYSQPQPLQMQPQLQMQPHVAYQVPMMQQLPPQIDGTMATQPILIGTQPTMQIPQYSTLSNPAIMAPGGYYYPPPLLPYAQGAAIAAAADYEQMAKAAESILESRMAQLKTPLGTCKDR